MKKAVKTFVKIVCAVLTVVLIVAGCAGAVLLKLSSNSKSMMETCTRLDSDGWLYSMDCTEDMYSTAVSLPLKYFTIQKTAGCSAFYASGNGGDALTGRNYDLPHKKRDDGSLTGLNVVLKCHPEGKYKSLCIADACWISVLGMDYYAGGLDNPDLNKIPVSLMPYLCMDGMNEKGLTVSILSLDIKDGETAVYQNEKGKEKVIISYILRYMLDECSTVEEAESLARRYNLTNLMGSDFHLFVSDAYGDSAVFEWRYNELKVTHTDAATNFYCGFDDAEDCYYDGKLKEAFKTPAVTSKEYHYGYGHGYERFRTVVTALDKTEKFSETGAMELLDSVFQEYTGEMTSFTQYSVVYNQTQKTAKVKIRGEEFEFSMN